VGRAYDGREVQEDRRLQSVKKVISWAALFVLDTTFKAASIIFFYLLFSAVLGGFKT